MENKFETEVLTRLTKIETKLDDYSGIKDKAEHGYTQSNENKRDIEEINDKIKWLSRTTGAALIGALISLLFLFVQKGVGLR